MLSVSGQVKVFLALQPTDMRKSFDTLAALVQESAPAGSAVGPSVRVSLEARRSGEDSLLEHAGLRAVVHAVGSRQLSLSHAC